jgi:GT2 family glycosyltransferase/nucleoside phosphorylase
MLFQLIITAATKKELPCEWLKGLGYPVVTLKGLKSGILSVQRSTFKVQSLNTISKGVLFVITGVGQDTAREAAEWIRDNLKPLFVVNMGMAGGLSKKLNLGDWVVPKVVANEQGDEIELETKLPFEFKSSVKQGKLLTVKKPNFEKQRLGYDYVDMEAYAQAKVFQGAGVTFTALKKISDYSDQNTIADFNRTIKQMQVETQDIASLRSYVVPPQFSVIIPVYNREDRIEACVNSVLNQSRDARDTSRDARYCVSTEIIVVDDGSTDRTVDKLKAIKDERLKIITLKQNKGVSYARNRGIEAATGEWLCFLDSDDLWQRHKLKKQIEFMKEYPFYKIHQCEEIWIRNGKRVNPCKHHQKPQGWIFEPSLNLCLISPSSVAIHKSVFEKVGMFDEELPACEDYDLWLRIARWYPVGLEPYQGVIKHGGHSDQLSRKYEAMDRFRVKSLQKLLEVEKNEKYKEMIKKVLDKKLKILENGARKREGCVF